MTDRWTNYRKCLYFLRFSNTCIHASSFMLMSSLKCQTLLGPVYSHFFLTKTIKALLQKPTLHFLPFPRTGFFLALKLKTRAMITHQLTRWPRRSLFGFQSPPFHTPSRIVIYTLTQANLHSSLRAKHHTSQT